MAYNVATTIESVREDDGKVHLNVRYTGNAGEIPIIRPIYINASAAPDPDFVRRQAINQITALNVNVTAQSTMGSMGVIDTTTPLPTPANSIQRFYVASSAPFTPGTTPQDVFSITGSASKTVIVQRIGLVGTQTTAGNNVWSLLRRTTANTLGTSAAVAAFQYDLNSAVAASATVLAYTANPTLGTLGGKLWGGKLEAPAPATASIGGNFEAIVPLDWSSPIVLGANQVVAWNFGGAALPTGLSLICQVWWSEV